jgi:hypothetical protein
VIDSPDELALLEIHGTDDIVLLAISIDIIGEVVLPELNRFFVVSFLGAHVLGCSPAFLGLVFFDEAGAALGRLLEIVLFLDTGHNLGLAESKPKSRYVGILKRSAVGRNTGIFSRESIEVRAVVDLFDIFDSLIFGVINRIFLGPRVIDFLGGSVSVGGADFSFIDEFAEAGACLERLHDRGLEFLLEFQNVFLEPVDLAFDVGREFLEPRFHGLNSPEGFLRPEGIVETHRYGIDVNHGKGRGQSRCAFEGEVCFLVLTGVLFFPGREFLDAFFLVADLKAEGFKDVFFKGVADFTAIDDTVEVDLHSSEEPLFGGFGHLQAFGLGFFVLRDFGFVGHALFFLFALRSSFDGDSSKDVRMIDIGFSEKEIVGIGERKGY